MIAPNRDDPFVTSVIHEIDDLHRFFTLWFGGRVEKSEAHFARFRDALDPRFGQVNPKALYRDRARIVQDVWNNWNFLPGDPNLRIWVERVRVEHVLPGDHALCIYEEWSIHKGETIGRTCTGLLTRQAGTPTGIAWLAMHESVMAPGSSPGQS
jgi:hypothetical protein